MNPKIIIAIVIVVIILILGGGLFFYLRKPAQDIAVPPQENVIVPQGQPLINDALVAPDLPKPVETSVVVPPVAEQVVVPEDNVMIARPPEGSPYSPIWTTEEQYAHVSIPSYGDALDNYICRSFDEDPLVPKAGRIVKGTNVCLGMTSKGEIPLAKWQYLRTHPDLVWSSTRPANLVDGGSNAKYKFGYCRYKSGNGYAQGTIFNTIDPQSGMPEMCMRGDEVVGLKPVSEFEYLGY